MNQTYKNFELIIVNDASPEDLDSIVNSYNDPRIRYYVNEENIGGKDLVAQWNHCLLYATGEYVILASDDDVYHLEYLEKMDVLVNKYPDGVVFRPRIQIIDKDGSITNTEAFTKEQTSLPEFMFLHGKRHIMSGVPYYIYKRKALLDMGGFINFPMAWGSDDATVMSLIKKHDLITIDEILFSFRMSNENITSKRNDSFSLAKKIDARLQFYKWRKNLIMNIDPKSELESFYIKYLQNNASRQHKKIFMI